MFESTTPVEVPATESGALDHFASTCSCGMVMRSTMRTSLDADRDGHARWHAGRAA